MIETRIAMGKPTAPGHAAWTGDRRLGRSILHDAYMGGCDAPSLGKADPCVAHAAYPLRFALRILDIGGGEVPPKRRNNEMALAPAQVSRLAPRAEGRNGIVPVQVFGRPEAQRVRRIPEKLIHRRCVVGEQRLLVATDRRRDFGDDAGVVDILHGILALIGGDDETTVEYCIVAGQRKTNLSISVMRSGNAGGN
jgi:hypothetical protein